MKGALKLIVGVICGAVLGLIAVGAYLDVAGRSDRTGVWLPKGTI